MKIREFLGHIAFEVKWSFVTLVLLDIAAIGGGVNYLIRFKTADSFIYGLLAFSLILTLIIGIMIPTFFYVVQNEIENEIDQKFQKDIDRFRETGELSDSIADFLEYIDKWKSQFGL
jgi:hypothetical protein